MYNVLIADDEKLMRDALALMVSKVEGFKVVAKCVNGEEAVDYCKKNHVDIVFSDIVMPLKNGLEASKEILEINPEISIYIVTAFSNFEFAREALDLKICEYILKPVSISKIRSILQYYKQCYNNGNQEIKSLLEILKNKDYKKMYYQVPEMATQLYNSAKHDEQKIKKTFELIHSTLLQSCSQQSFNYQQSDIHGLVSTSKDNGKYLEFRLFDILDKAFKTQSISKFVILESVFDYIDENIKNPIGLTDVTEKCIVSQGYLSRIFKQQFGISVMEYIHMRKLMIAKEYFTFTNKSVVDVAYMMGYNESNYFGKVFKKYEMITANQYRNKVHE